MVTKDFCDVCDKEIKSVAFFEFYGPRAWVEFLPKEMRPRRGFGRRRRIGFHMDICSATCFIEFFEKFKATVTAT
jgi:hypothetical protein